MIVPEPIAAHMLMECLGRPQSHRELARLCDTVGGRTSGATSGARAEEWAYDLFTRWRLEDVRYEEFEIDAWRRGSLDAEVLEPMLWSLTALAHGNAPLTADVTADIVDVGRGEPWAFAARADDTCGAIALCQEGASEGRRRLHRSEKLRLAHQAGAVGLMIHSSAAGRVARTGMCHIAEAPIPSIGISREDGLRIKRLLADGRVVARIKMQNDRQTGTARNVLGDIRGRDGPAELVLAGAHLDSWDVAQGATDNGLGCAIVLEMARAMATLGLRPRRTLRFALWAAEETGLHGSRYYVSQHGPELDRHAAVMNFDMTGAPIGFWTPGHPGPPDLLRGLCTQLAPLGVRGVFEHGARLHSDHQPFMLAGVPVVCLQSELQEDGRRYYHSFGDTFEKISCRDLCLAAAAGAHTMWALADAPAPPLPHLTPGQVQAMIEEAHLVAALQAQEQENGGPR